MFYIGVVSNIRHNWDKKNYAKIMYNREFEKYVTSFGTIVCIPKEARQNNEQDKVCHS